MKIKLIFLMLVVAALIMPSMSNAYVDAKYWIKDDKGNLIYMIDNEGKMVYGNVLVGQDIIFDASQSKSAYRGVDKYYWDFDGDGRYDTIVSVPYVHHIYRKPGIYNAKLLAVDTSGPNGAADTYVRKIRVVEKYIPPVADFRIRMVDNTSSEKTFMFDASASDDPDGYIKYYDWDFDGDGKYDKKVYRLDNISWSFNESGYYDVTLEVEDWDGMKSTTSRILKVDGVQGSVAEVNGSIVLVNEGKTLVNVTVTINNCDIQHVEVSNKKSIEASLNPGGPNEVCINLSGVPEKYFIFDGDSVEIHLLPGGGIEIKSGGGIPGFGLVALLLSIIFLFFKRNSLKI